MPWATSDRATRLPADWPSRRAATKRRAQGQCEAVHAGQRCTAPGTDCDHITPGDNHDLTNLQWLCPSDHKAKTARESTAARATMNARRTHPVEQHPAQTPRHHPPPRP